MKTNIHFWSYLAHFCFEWEVFQTKFVEKLEMHILWSITFPEVCWDSIVGISICYRLNGPGIKSRCEQDFPHPSRPAQGPTQPHIRLVRGYSQGVKQPVQGVDHQPQSRAEVKERAELHLYFPSVNFTFYTVRFYHIPRLNLLKTKRNLFYIRNQSIPRSKHFPPRL